MEIRCEKCNGATRPKKITSKKNGKQYTLAECQAGCMNGRFPYSFFPPSEKESAQIKHKIDSALVLNEINQKLAIIIDYLEKMGGDKQTQDEFENEVF